MKKLFAMMLALVMALSLVACGGNDTATEDTSEDTATEETAGGSVYYLNFKPEADQAWQDLAALYTEQTGVEVKVVTAASGEYNNTLTAEMGKSEAPTLFQCGNAQSLLDWGDYCLDLTGTPVLGEMTTADFNLVEDGATKAIGYCYEAFGIIVNKALLETAGYTLADITDFASLKAVAEDIHARASELGFDAFSSSGLDGSSSWRFSGHLANMPLFYEFRDDAVTAQPAEITGAYLDNFRAIWDLYIDNASAEKTSLTTATGDMSSGEFKEGKAVFYQNGTWEFAGLVEAGIAAEDLAMIPIYCGVEGESEAGLCCGTENCWAVNSQASEEDIAATLEFLNYVVTSEEGLAMMMKEFGAIPFKNAPASTNKFVADGANLVNAGKYPVTWAFTTTPNVDNWRAGIVSALAAYSADQTDDNWKAVVDAFVVGWEIEYAAQNG